MTAPDTDTLAGLLAECTPGLWAFEILMGSDPNGDEHPTDVEVMTEKGYFIHNHGLGYSDRVDVEILANARLISLAPELAVETITLRAQAAKDKARVERLEAALKGARALLRSGADLLAIESEALREGITVNGELRADPEDAPAVEAIEDIEAWIADVADFVNARAALEDGE